MSMRRVSFHVIKHRKMIKLTQDINLENHTLILPSVAIGNVGQLSIDLLIANFNLQKIGQIFSTAFVPVVGANAYHEQSNELVTAIDIYAGTEKKRIVVVQIRSPYVAKLTEFFNELRQFITERKIVKVIILTSSYDYEKREVQPNPLKLRYIASPNIQTENGKLFDDLSWILHKPKDECDTSGEKLQIPGGGFARSIFNFLVDTNIPCAVLFKFCSEGDNTSDALCLVHYLDQWIGNMLGTCDRSVTWKYPLSWKHLFGQPPLCGMY